MKKTVLLLVLSIIFNSLMAQLVITDTLGNEISGQTITLNEAETFYFYIKNNSDSTVHFQIKAQEVVLEQGNIWEVCGGGVCIQVSEPTLIGRVMPLDAGQENTDGHITFLGSGLKGLNSITISVYNPFNNQDSTYVIFNCEYSTKVDENFSFSQKGNILYFSDYQDIVWIFDLNGKEILKAQKIKELNLNSLPKGIYILKTVVASKINTQKIFIR